VLHTVRIEIKDFEMRYFIATIMTSPCGTVVRRLKSNQFFLFCEIMSCFKAQTLIHRLLYKCNYEFNTVKADIGPLLKKWKAQLLKQMLLLKQWQKN